MVGRLVVALGFLLACAGAAACSDDDEAPSPLRDGNPNGPNGADADGGAGTKKTSAELPINPGESPLRRLTNEEYDNTAADLLGDTTHPGQAFPGASTSTQGYDTYASGLGVSFENGSGAKLTVSDIVVDSSTAISAIVTIQKQGNARSGDSSWDLRVGDAVLRDAFVVLP